MASFWIPVIQLLTCLCLRHAAAQLISKADSGLVSDVHIDCNSNNIMVTVATANDFNGMIYPKGLSKNSTCMVEYSNAGDHVTYTLPLRSCNTMSTDVDDGVEYFNTVVIQPHRKLVTNQGRGYHIRCRYQTKDKTITNNFNVSMLGTTPLTATAPMPICTMKIFIGTEDQGYVAENVKIGDQLTLVIQIEAQDVYGMKVTNCMVRDGLNWGEQPLINTDGCPVDDDIMGPFQYSENQTRAMVSFQAHKFPYTASVYYQCNVKLCLKQGGGCEDVPPACDSNGVSLHRRRRQADVQEKGTLKEIRGDEDTKALNIEVYSGLYVNEAENAEESEDAVTAQPRVDDDEFCVSTRKFAIGIAIAGVLLMLAVMLLVACILHRRRRRKGASTAGGSSIYSGPYSNHAYSRD